MIRSWSVLEKIRQFVTVDDSEAAELMPFCALAASEIEANARADADLNDIRLLMAAAASAYRNYICVKKTRQGSVSAFKAGDVSVSTDYESALDTAEMMMREATAAAAPLLTDKGFLFTAV